jgi:hypothetical protein
MFHLTASGSSVLPRRRGRCSSTFRTSRVGSLAYSRLRQTSPGAPTVGTTLLARRVYAGRETNVDCRILDWQADRSVTMEILGGPTRRAVATYEVESIGDDACRVTYTVDGEMRRGLGWLTPVIPRVGRGPVKANLISLGRRLGEAATATAGARAAAVSPPDRA